MQRGLKTQGCAEVVFASENETKIRHFYRRYFEYLGTDEVPVAVGGVPS